MTPTKKERARKGYTPDNITVMSRRANTLKNNATLLELQQLVTYLQQPRR